LAERVLLLLGLGVGDDDHGAEAQRIGDHREADPRVSRRALDDGAAGLQQSSRLGVHDNTQRHAILYRSAGVHEFGLAEDFAAGQLRKATQADERGPADVAIHSMVA